MEKAFGKDLRFVSDLRDRMKNHNFMLSYRGYFSQDITKALLQVTEKKLDHDGAENSVKKKVFNVMVECLQNIAKHNDASKEADADSLFMLGRTDNSYVIYSGNVILEEKVHELRNKLLEINSMSVEEIKEVYKMIIAGSSGFSEKAGAGLGLIDIAKKSGSKLDFDFEHVNEKYAFFSLRTTVVVGN